MSLWRHATPGTTEVGNNHLKADDMAKRRIARAELAIGTVLAWDVFDDRGRLLLKRGQIVSSDTQLDALIERGLFTEDDPVPEKAEYEAGVLCGGPVAYGSAGGI